MDAALVEWLNGWAGKVNWLDNIVLALVSDYFFPVAGSLFLFGLWFYGKGINRITNQLNVIAGVMGIGFANLITQIINHSIYRPRPFVELDLILLFYRPSDSSFPSNTAALGFAIATAIFFRFRRLGCFAYLLAIIYGLARIYSGVHYPTDIIAGSAVGVAGAASAYFVTTRVLKPLVLRLLGLGRYVFLA